MDFLSDEIYHIIKNLSGLEIVNYCSSNRTLQEWCDLNIPNLKNMDHQLYFRAVNGQFFRSSVPEKAKPLFKEMAETGKLNQRIQNFVPNLPAYFQIIDITDILIFIVFIFLSKFLSNM